MSIYLSILASFFFGETARTIYLVTISWLLYQMTGRAEYTGLLVGLGFLPSLLTNLYLGAIIDRFSRKKLALFALIGHILSICLVYIALTMLPFFPSLILTIHMFHQLMGTLFRATMQAHCAKSFPSRQLTKVIAYTNTFTELGALLGASLGGLIIKTLNVNLVITTMICLYIATLFTLLMIKEHKEPQVLKGKNRNIHLDLFEGLHYLFRHRHLFRLFSLTMAGQLVLHTSIGFLSVYTIEQMGHSSIIYGFLDALISIGGGMAGLTGIWWFRQRRQFHTASALIITGFGLLILGLSSTPIAVICIGVFLIGLSTTWIRIVLQSTQQILTDKAYHGRMSSYRMTINHLSIVIAAPLLGWLAEVYSAASAYLFLLIPVSIALFIALQPKTLALLKQAVQQSFLS
ncbi:MFS transporter [Amphibacillus sediminis]|uniref:MFS transporter n=1 Tax=Amphibacillus sediminis TaxID=360185 RepID=UPI0008369BD8|nr:MFS transporter [Amphibacillus sediminis]